MSEYPLAGKHLQKPFYGGLSVLALYLLNALIAIELEEEKGSGEMH